MDLQKVKEIFEREKEDLLIEIEPQEQPMAFILGGQPASGKSKLANVVMAQFPNDKFLFVNGDVYREFHPEVAELIKNSKTYSEKTQIFSNVFTENLIKEAIKNKYNIIVEGTMRNPQIPLNTAKLFKENGFKVEALAISAPSIFTELGVYIRYQEEINIQGWGRLADINSYYSAVEGLPLSLDTLYKEKAVDKIHLYSYQAEKHISSYELIDGKWDYDVLPSVELVETKTLQLQDKECIVDILDRGTYTYNQIEEALKNEVGSLLDELEDILEELKRKQDRPRGLRR